MIWVRLPGRSQLSNPSDLPCYSVTCGRIHTFYHITIHRAEDTVFVYVFYHTPCAHSVSDIIDAQMQNSILHIFWCRPVINCLPGRGTGASSLQLGPMATHETLFCDILGSGTTNQESFDIIQSGCSGTGCPFSLINGFGSGGDACLYPHLRSCPWCGLIDWWDRWVSPMRGL